MHSGGGVWASSFLCLQLWGASLFVLGDTKVFGQCQEKYFASQTQEQDMNPKFRVIKRTYLHPPHHKTKQKKQTGIRMASFYISLLEFTNFFKEAEVIIIEIKKD